MRILWRNTNPPLADFTYTKTCPKTWYTQIDTPRLTLHQNLSQNLVHLNWHTQIDITPKPVPKYWLNSREANYKFYTKSGTRALPFIFWTFPSPCPRSLHVSPDRSSTNVPPTKKNKIDKKLQCSRFQSPTSRPWTTRSWPCFHPRQTQPIHPDLTSTNQVFEVPPSDHTVGVSHTSLQL